MSNPAKIKSAVCNLRKWISILSITNILVCFFAISAVAQTSVTATLKSDSNHILIGDHLNLRLAVKHPKNLKVAMPVAKDSIGNMEFISASKIDTVIEAADEIYVQNFTVSAFDSGEFHAGPMPVLFISGPGKIDTVLSNEILVAVSTLPVDTNKAFKPIKGPLEVPFSWREFIPYIIGGVILWILALVGLLLYLKYKKEKPVIVARPQPKDPPHIWARKELQKLEQEKLWQSDQAKLYYSRLTETLRLYLEYRYGWLALESTSQEIESEIDNYNIKDKAKDSLLQILRTADLVKFAKMLPTPDVNIKAMELAYKFIDFTEPKEEDKTKS